MKQYLQLLNDVLEKGTHKDAARENMPGTTSLFGYQFRHDLKNGFPLLTTKKISFKNIVIELLWFLKGDTNIKYLVDNNCMIWCQDAYNYYLKKIKDIDKYEEPPFQLLIDDANENKLRVLKYDEFVSIIKNNDRDTLEEQYCSVFNDGIYILGDCGAQYGWLWRRLNSVKLQSVASIQFSSLKKRYYDSKGIDQIKNLIDGLKNNPESRRHIISAWNVPTLNNMALNACHAFVQFNCRKLTKEERIRYYLDNYLFEFQDDFLEVDNIPKYYLDCQLYIRSNDLFLGAPYNIASYALLIHIIGKICNMIPGELIYTIGDAHIYDNHLDAVREQLKRVPFVLPNLELSDDINWENVLNEDFNYLYITEALIGYEPKPSIKGELSTGMI